MSSVPEKDWKLFRKLQSQLTAKACELVFEQVDIIVKNKTGNEHQSYLDLYDLVQDEDVKIAEMFNNPTRNNVFLKIVALSRFGVLSSEQLQQFSEETQEMVRSMLEFR